jgi:hypothetical protein
MRKLTHGATRLGTAAVAAAVLMTAACDDATAPWPSRGPATGMAIYTIPAGEGYLLVRGESLRLQGVATDASGTWVDAPVTWSSSNDAIATITSDGVLTAVGNVNPSEVDTITVTAQSAGQTATQSVIIRRFPAVVTAALSPASSTPFIAPGVTLQLSARGLDASGNEVPGRTFTWATSDEGVATVTNTGLVSIVGTGFAEITATTLEDTTQVSVTRRFTTVASMEPGTITHGTIGTGSFEQYTIIVPPGTSTLRVTTTGGTGDADVYLYAPGTVPGAATAGQPGSGAACASFNDGNVENCVVSNPTPGVWGLRLMAWGGAPDVTGLVVTLQVD